ncbi:MAG: type IV pilus biogenesis/stability protein PilW [Pseudomonadales bacterium]
MKKLPRLFTYLALVVILAGCAIGAADPNQKPPREQAKEYTDAGAGLFAEGDNINAKRWLREAIKLDSSYGRAYAVLARVFQTEKETELAREYFLRAIKEEPKSAISRNMYGAFLFSQQEFSAACKQLELASDDPFYPFRARVFENLGRCYLALDQTEKADQAFERSANLGGRSTYLLLVQVRKHMRQDEVFKANKVYAEFLDLVSINRAQHSADSLILGIELARKTGNLQDVVTYSLLLENLFPNNYKAYKESTQ